MKKVVHLPTLFLLYLVFAVSCNKSGQQQAFVSSPDSLIQVQCTVGDSGIFYSVTYRDEEIIKPSGFEIDFKHTGSLKDNLEITEIANDTVNETWERVWGKRKTVTNHYNQVTLKLRETVRPHRLINLYFRAYNDGIALRYELPVQKGMDSIILSNEKMAFSFPGESNAWPAFWNTFHLSQEVEFTKSKISDIKPGNIIGTPLLVNSGRSWVALLEANITDWACSGFTADRNHMNTIISRPSWLPDDTTVIVKTASQRLSPWKVMMIADQPGRFIESDILQNLNEPCALEDVSWIKPGVSAWDWWWSGSYAPDVKFKPGPNTETMKYFIDFAAEMGWQYQIVDWQWYGPPFKEDGSFNSDADITRMIPEIDIPEIVKYADSRGIKIIIWLLWPNVDKQMEEAFALYEKWGVSGVKIDFMDRNDQEMVHFYHRVAKTAAKHHLVVDFHGAYVPDGFSRTYPNLITREGILGNEYNKWSSRITPVHCVTIPFTRMLAGEMDFTPGGFLNDQPDQFVVVGGDSPAPHVMGTRCFQLAMFVVYESAFEVFCESPYNVRNKAGSDFLKSIPSSWDETKFLEGAPGEFIAIARRSGDRWYIGGMSVDSRTFSIKTDFLNDKVNYKAFIWSDGPEAVRKPRTVVTKDIQINKGAEISVEVSPNGGFVIVVDPEGSGSQFKRGKFAN
jgi:alpha-glucosidase